MRHFQFQHHDGDDDGDDAVAEGFEPVLFHAAILTGALAHRNHGAKLEKKNVAPEF